MTPCFSIGDLGNGPDADAETLGDSLEFVPLLAQRSNRDDICFGQLRHTMRRTLVDLDAQYVVLMAFVFAWRHKLQIVGASVAFVAVFVVMHVAGWAFAKKCFGDETMDCPTVRLTVKVYDDSWVISWFRPDVASQYLMVYPPDSSGIAGFV